MGVPATPFARRTVAVALAALTVRVAYALAFELPRAGDPLEYHMLANVLADSGEYAGFGRLGELVPWVEKPPLYPAYLALGSVLGLDSLDSHRMLSGVLGTATVVVVALIGRRIGGERMGLTAGLVAALYPVLWLLDGSLRSESLYALLVALILLCALRALERPDWRRMGLLGALVGLATLTRGEGLALLGLVGLPVAWVSGGRRRWGALLALVIGCGLLVAPWVARNSHVSGQLVGVSTNEGGLIAGANCDRAYYGPAIGSWPCRLRPHPSWGSNHAVWADKWRAQGVDYARDHLGRVPTVMAVRVLRTWELYDPWQESATSARFYGQSLIATRAGLIAYYILVVLAMYGAWRLRTQGMTLYLLLSPVVLVTVTSALTYGVPRFRAAADVTIILLGAAALVALADRLRAWRPSRRASGARGVHTS